ncbi:hypothetical protein L596_025192 [Steinernema carpocapsae]|uniref:Uncharacterized protein n=1 Tax=Steinernema carpocapsae TaxID=34508 RepID=A0A4U5M788_STECR|nr:hypothetical protein L596_025192 [Steinernema carpocapsae]
MFNHIKLSRPFKIEEHLSGTVVALTKNIKPVSSLASSFTWYIISFSGFKPFLTEKAWLATEVVSLKIPSIS